MNEDQLRKDFEEWWTVDLPDADMRRDGAGYWNEYCNEAWITWMACYDKYRSKGDEK